MKWSFIRFYYTKAIITDSFRLDWVRNIFMFLTCSKMNITFVQYINFDRNLHQLNWIQISMDRCHCGANSSTTWHLATRNLIPGAKWIHVSIHLSPLRQAWSGINKSKNATHDNERCRSRSDVQISSSSSLFPQPCNVFCHKRRRGTTFVRGQDKRNWKNAIQPSTVR